MDRVLIRIVILKRLVHIRVPRIGIRAVPLPTHRTHEVNNFEFKVAVDLLTGDRGGVILGYRAS